MESFKGCMQFQEDLRGLLFDGSNLEKEDSGLFDYISSLDNPKGVLDHSRNFKDEGNSSFREGDFDGALEKFSLSCVFLSCLVLQEEDARMSFSQLATSTVLNMAASLLKKNEFRQVGQLCSIILKYNPQNVKALFRRAIAALGLEKIELASWDLKLAYEVEPSNQEVVRKLSEVEMLLHKPPHEHGQGKEKRMKHSKGMSGTNSDEEKEVLGQGQEERPNNIETGNCTPMEVESKDASTNVKVLTHVVGDSKSTEVEMREREEDNKFKDKESRSNQELKKQKYHFYSKRRPESALAISKRDYHLLAQGRTLQHYNPRSGIVMSIRVKTPPLEASKQPSERQPHQNPHSPTMDKLGHIPQKDNITQGTEVPDTQNLSTENPISEPEEVMMEQATCDAPTIQDCSSTVIPFDPSHICFLSITTANRSPPRKAKHRAPEKGVKKETRVKHRKSSCVLANHVFQCRFKVAARINHLPSSHNLPDYRSGMKRKPTSLQSPDLPQQPRKFIIIKNDVCNSCSTSGCSSSMQVNNFIGCMNCVRI